MISGSSLSARPIRTILNEKRSPGASNRGPNSGGSIFKRIVFYSANMTGLLVKKNGIVIEESIKALNDYNQTEYRKVPQAGLYMFDSIVDDNQSQVFNSRDAQTIEVLGTFSGAETITMESEVLEPLGAF